MTRNEFIEILKNNMTTLDESVVFDKLKYYNDYIDAEISKGRVEEDVINELGDPRLIAITIKEVTDDLNNFKITESTMIIFKFVDELSNWYIRRNRERFWASGMEQDKINAYSTLYKVLIEFSILIAPYVPFISEEIYTNLVQ